MRLFLVSLLSLGACGGPPALQNAPRPNPTAVAGGAAAIAGAATLADPDAAAKKAESNKVDDEKRPIKSGGTVPPDVLDRLDDKKKEPATKSEAPAKTDAP